MSKLTSKLVIMFSAVILSYAVILVYNFSHFTADVLNTHHVDIIFRGAENAAETFERMLPENTRPDNFIQTVRNLGNVEYSLAMLSDISDYSYSLCDQNGEYLYLNEDQLVQKNDIALIPEAETVRDSALAGESSCLEFPTKEGHIIAGAAPIHNGQGETVGILLILHQAGDSAAMQSKINRFLFGLTLVVLLLLLLVSVFMSFRFTAPIRKITQIANELAHGNLSIQTNIHQKDEIGQLAYSMDQLAIELRKSKEIQRNEAKMHDNFLADISHELKTPVTVIRGSLESLADGVIKDPEDVAAYYQQMLAESQYLQKLIQDLLMISTLKTKEFKIKQELVHLSEVMSDTAMSARGMAMKKKIQFVTQPPENDFVILGDYELIRKLLMLILDNAVKYTESGKSIYYYQTDRGEIVIQDEGAGMDQEAVSHIFKRFYRQGKGIERGSSGMGLAIAKEIAVRHQIEIQVESTVGTGTTFTLIFPVDKISVEN